MSSNLESYSWNSGGEGTEGGGGEGGGERGQKEVGGRGGERGQKEVGGRGGERGQKEVRSYHNVVRLVSHNGGLRRCTGQYLPRKKKKIDVVWALGHIISLQYQL